MFSRDWAINILKNNPNQKITHRLFDSDEYVYGKNGKVYDENGYLFEDWVSEGIGKHDGMRMRVGGSWEDGWDIRLKLRFLMEGANCDKRDDAVIVKCVFY